MGNRLRPYFRDGSRTAWGKESMDQFLEREQDRGLFELPPRPANREP